MTKIEVGDRVLATEYGHTFTGEVTWVGRSEIKVDYKVSSRYFSKENVVILPKKGRPRKFGISR